MLFVTFSHYSLLHLIINMYVLYDFCKIAVTELGREQFLALYLTSGVVSSFSSYLYKATVGIKDPSLGAVSIYIKSYISNVFIHTNICTIVRSNNGCPWICMYPVSKCISVYCFPSYVEIYSKFGMLIFINNFNYIDLNFIK